MNGRILIGRLRVAVTQNGGLTADPNTLAAHRIWKVSLSGWSCDATIIKLRSHAVFTSTDANRCDMGHLYTIMAWPALARFASVCCGHGWGCSLTSTASWRCLCAAILRANRYSELVAAHASGQPLGLWQYRE